MAAAAAKAANMSVIEGSSGVAAGAGMMLLPAAWIKHSRRSVRLRVGGAPAVGGEGISPEVDKVKYLRSGSAGDCPSLIKIVVQPVRLNRTKALARERRNAVALLGGQPVRGGLRCASSRASAGCHCSLRAQLMQSAASGRASRRAGAIAAPQRTQSP